MKRKRSVASYRAASLKAARTRQRMKEARGSLQPYFERQHLKFLERRPTIDRIPKVEWRW